MGEMRKQVAMGITFHVVRKGPKTILVVGRNG